VLIAAVDWDKAEATRKPDFLAHRGSRLSDAQTLASRGPDWAREIAPARAYLAACQAHETEQRDKQRRIIGRAFVKPALQALEDRLSDHAIRLAAAGASLANDIDLKLVPQLWSFRAGDPPKQCPCGAQGTRRLCGHFGVQPRWQALGDRVS
jgi:hypothetical protein